jgi:DNA-binding phage protein
MPSKPTKKKRKARKPAAARRDRKINFSDFQVEDYLKTEESIRAFETASEADSGDTAFMAIVNDIASRARKRLKVARTRTKRRI